MGLKRHSYSSYRANLLIILVNNNNNNIIILPIFLLSVLRRHTISLFKSPRLSNGVVDVCLCVTLNLTHYSHWHWPVGSSCIPSSLQSGKINVIAPIVHYICKFQDLSRLGACILLAWHIDHLDCLVVVTQWSCRLLVVQAGDLGLIPKLM